MTDDFVKAASIFPLPASGERAAISSERTRASTSRVRGCSSRTTLLRTELGSLRLRSMPPLTAARIGLCPDPSAASPRARGEAKNPRAGAVK